MRAALLLSAVCACARTDVAALLPLEGTADASVDAADADTFDAKPSGFPNGSMPTIVIGPVSDLCAPTIAEHRFRFALCSCEDFVAASPLTSDSFDSRSGPYLAGGKGGSVGVDRHLNAMGPFSIEGSLWVGDPGGLQAGAGGRIDVAGELRSDGPLLSEAEVRVDHDAWIRGRVTAGDLFVAGTLRLPSNEPIEVSGTEEVGVVERADFDVEPPCECDASQILDVPAFVRANAGTNDDAAIGLDPSALVAVSGPARLELPGGRFYLDGIAGPGSLTISVLGRAALFVAGDIALESPLIVDAAPGGELDLFVEGAITGRFTLGSPDRPAHVRVYLGTSGTLRLEAGAVLSGNLYAPRAELLLAAPLEVFGSIFARRLSAADLTVHYDTAVLAAADDCPESPPATCTRCDDCRRSACRGGACVPCTDSSECCAPLSCVDGACLPEP